MEHLDVLDRGLLGVGVALEALGFFALHRRDPGKPYAWCFAKNAAVFLDVALRPKLAILFAEPASSSRSAVARPVRSCVRSAYARRTYKHKADGVRSRSRATAPIVLPLSRTKRTAWLQNSSTAGVGADLSGFAGIRDIESTFRKMSTKPDQAHYGDQCGM